MPHNTNQATMAAFFAALEGTQNIMLNSADNKFKLYDVGTSTFKEIWLENGVLQVETTGE